LTEEEEEKEGDDCGVAPLFPPFFPFANLLESLPPFPSFSIFLTSFLPPPPFFPSLSLAEVKLGVLEAEPSFPLACEEETPEEVCGCFPIETP
jgi:hypothetical protein